MYSSERYTKDQWPKLRLVDVCCFSRFRPKSYAYRSIIMRIQSCWTLITDMRLGLESYAYFQIVAINAGYMTFLLHPLCYAKHESTSIIFCTTYRLRRVFRSSVGLPRVLEYYSSNFFTTRVLVTFYFPVANLHFRLQFLQLIDELSEFMATLGFASWFATCRIVNRCEYTCRGGATQPAAKASAQGYIHHRCDVSFFTKWLKS